MADRERWLDPADGALLLAPPNDTPRALAVADVVSLLTSETLQSLTQKCVAWRRLRDPRLLDSR